MLEVTINGRQYIPVPDAPPCVRGSFMARGGKVTIGSALLRWRGRTRLNRSVVARAVDMSDSHIAQLEAGMRIPRIDTLMALIRYYKPPVSEILEALQITQEPET